MLTQPAFSYQEPFQLVQYFTLYTILVSFPPGTLSMNQEPFDEKDFEEFERSAYQGNDYERRRKGLLAWLERLLQRDLAKYFLGKGHGSGSNPYSRPTQTVNPYATSGGSYDTQAECGYLRARDPSRSRRDSPIRRRPSIDGGIQSRAQSILTKIIGGQSPQSGSWPWMAAIGSRKTPNNIMWFCGGTLISPYYVISAVHCFEKILPNIFVRLGSHKIDNKFGNSPPAMDIMVSEVMKHNKFSVDSKGLVYNDVALLRFANAVPLSDYIQPICLAPPGDLGHPGENLLIAGWGATEKGRLSSDLLETIVPVVEESQCKQSYGPEIDSRVICAGGNGKDTCQGDSAGPLVAVRASRHYLVGIVSFGRGCGDPDSPGVYTRVSQFTDWIGNPFGRYTSLIPPSQ